MCVRVCVFLLLFFLSKRDDRCSQSIHNLSGTNEKKYKRFKNYDAYRECLYSPEDLTRSSPFFWAFAQAFPDNADQIFGITDSIPAPIKEVGPALQTIELTNTSPAVTGKLVSRVKVATLNGMATSIMTTRADIVGSVGVDGLKIRIDTTKPEESTVIQKLPPPFNTLVADALPPFPSGDALEQVMPGSSTVVMRTTFCDDALRITRNDAKYDEVFVWRRKKFANSQDF